MNFHLGLRDNRHQVSLMRVDNRQQEVLGVAYPEESNRRARILEQWGQNGRSPRHHELGSIDMPLSSRAQAILSYQLAPDVQDRLNGGLEPMVQTRQQLNPGAQERMHLGRTGARFDLNPARKSAVPKAVSATPATRANSSLVGN